MSLVTESADGAYNLGLPFFYEYIISFDHKHEEMQFYSKSIVTTSVPDFISEAQQL
jgi:hypothetical protein